MPTAEPRIFVSIASYRDTECQWTIKDLFEKALNPERISVGICWQFVPGDDDDCFEIETRPEQCRVLEFHAKDSRGVCWARHQTQKLWQGEEFTLQIDSHMRFAPEWDRQLFEMHAECGNPRAILTSYPVPYEPPDQLSPASVVTITPKHFDAYGILLFGSTSVPIANAKPFMEPTAFCAAGFLFGPSAIIEEVPYDPHIYFQGEEITLAARLWTHGWDMFSPNRCVIYHDYSNRPDRMRHWKDDQDWGKLNQKAMIRIRHLLGIEESSDVGALVEIDVYGLGTVRTLAAYQAYSGINFQAQCIYGQLAKGPMQLDGDEEVSRRRALFTGIWQHNDWACDETRSGAGATLRETETLRRVLPPVFRSLNIATLTDAGCGEFNWMSRLSSGLTTYLGVDIVPGLIEMLRTTYAGRPGHQFLDQDLIAKTLPACDAILCRDCLTHLAPVEALGAIKRFKESGSEYLIATTHPAGRNADINSGGWHPMNLCAAPFNLPPPMRLLSEGLAGSSKSLGIWRLSTLPGT